MTAPGPSRPSNRMSRRTVVLGLIVMAGAFPGIVRMLRGMAASRDAIDDEASGDGPWAQVTLRVEGMY